VILVPITSFGPLAVWIEAAALAGGAGLLFLHGMAERKTLLA
jgi:hypothetical protein